MSEQGVGRIPEVKETELADFIGGFMYTQEESPRWSYISDITEEDEQITFHTVVRSADSVPRSVRQSAYDNYESGKLLLEGPDGGEQNVTTSTGTSQSDTDA